MVRLGELSALHSGRFAKGGEGIKPAVSTALWGVESNILAVPSRSTSSCLPPSLRGQHHYSTRLVAQVGDVNEV